MLPPAVNQTNRRSRKNGFLLDKERRSRDNSCSAARSNKSVVARRHCVQQCLCYSQRACGYLKSIESAYLLRADLVCSLVLLDLFQLWKVDGHHRRVVFCRRARLCCFRTKVKGAAGEEGLGGGGGCRGWKIVAARRDQGRGVSSGHIRGQKKKRRTARHGGTEGERGGGDNVSSCS